MALPYSPNRSKHWQDLLNLMLAIWLFISPWVLQFGQHAIAQPGAGITAVQAASSNALGARRGRLPDQRLCPLWDGAVAGVDESYSWRVDFHRATGAGILAWAL